MKPQLIALTLLLIFVGISCKKEDSCTPFENLGSLFWSDETEEWIPNEYFNLPHSIKYISESNEEKIFTLESTELIESLSWNTEVLCENGEGSTNYRYTAERYGGRFNSSDSMSIFFGLGVRNEVLAITDRTEVDFYEWVSMSMFNFDDASLDYDYGSAKILTDLRNAELEDIDHLGNDNTFHDSIEVGGEIFEKVYSDSNPSDSPANIFFKKGKGIIVFIDENGVIWKLEN